MEIDVSPPMTSYVAALDVNVVVGGLESLLVRPTRIEGRELGTHQ